MNERLIHEYLEFKQGKDLKYQGLTIKDSRKKWSAVTKLTLERSDSLFANKMMKSQSLVHHNLQEHTGSAANSQVLNSVSPSPQVELARTQFNQD